MDEKIIKDISSNNMDNNAEKTANNIDIPKSITSKKAEKICAAIFLVSNFLNEQEPIKWDMRKSSSQLISLTSKLAISSASERKQVIHESRKIVSELISLLEVASLAGIISGMNSSVLAKELGSLYLQLEKEDEINHRITAVKFPKHFFTHEEFLMLDEGKQDQMNDDKVSEKTKDIIKDKKYSSEIEQKNKAYINSQKEFHKIREYGSVAIKRNKRQSFIIQVLKRKKELTIKDISTIFHDCSEKTIQRELAVLVDDGVVVRDGERRWTKYSLALTV